MKRNGDNHAIPAANLIITFSFSEKKYAELLLLLLVVNNKCCNILHARAAAMQVNTYRFSRMVNSVGEKKRVLLVTEQGSKAAGLACVTAHHGKAQTQVSQQQ